jgi:drug/metabolite transporter (DMT)-like permease
VMRAEARPPAWLTLAAFAVIYFVWGSTYLAIRVGVREVPPFLLAALRFLLAGLVLYGWTIARGERSPNARQWISVFLLAVLIFIFDYGLLFWAEQRVPSGLAAVMLATIPVFIALAEIAFLGTQRLTIRLGAALLIGIAGVAVLVSGTLGASLKIGGAPIDRAGALALIISAISWSIATILTRKLPLPESKAMNSGAQMLAGGILLFLAAGALGEFRNFHPAAVSVEAWLALLYLSIAGSVIGFTAYIWLIHHESPTKVGTYAYVNPVVAVVMGYFFGGEALGARTIAGTLLVLVSVLVIAIHPAKKQLAAVAAGER